MLKFKNNNSSNNVLTEKILHEQSHDSLEELKFLNNENKIMEIYNGI